VKDNRWIDGEGDDLDRIQYGYDRASNRIWRKNVVAAALGKQFDELYTYDGVHRLQDMVRGTLNGGHTALTSETFAESWTLDSTGNWRGFKQDDNGDGTWSLIQSRTANPVNEITDIAESVGPSWVTPAYNRAGNMVTVPQPAAPTASYTATYDAWNRLVKIADDSNTVSEYAYDGAKRRIVQKSYDGGVLDETRHLYYTEPSLWQVVEERVGTSPDSADAERQFVWGKRYIDDLIARDRDTDDTGSLDERLYACQDANWNVAAITDNAETVQERYAYSAYGVPAFLTTSFISSGNTAFAWEVLYCGYLCEPSTSLTLVRHRVFNSTAGSWIQRDPVGYADSSHLYQYCRSTTLSCADTFGLGCKILLRCQHIRDVPSGCTRDCTSRCREVDRVLTATAPTSGGAVDDCNDPALGRRGSYSRDTTTTTVSRACQACVIAGGVAGPAGGFAGPKGCPCVFPPPACPPDHDDSIIFNNNDPNSGRNCKKSDCKAKCDSGDVADICNGAKGPWQALCESVFAEYKNQCTDFCNIWCNN